MKVIYNLIFCLLFVLNSEGQNTYDKISNKRVKCKYHKKAIEIAQGRIVDNKDSIFISNVDFEKLAFHPEEGVIGYLDYIDENRDLLSKQEIQKFQTLLSEGIYYQLKGKYVDCNSKKERIIYFEFNKNMQLMETTIYEAERIIYKCKIKYTAKRNEMIEVLERLNEKGKTE